jgi:diadenylate cyclase
VAVVIYRGMRYLLGTRGLQIVFGVLALLGIYIAAFLLKFTMITYLLGVLFTYGAFAVLVLFQPEVRNALARLGRSRVFGAFSASKTSAVAGQVAEAVERLSRNGTGAIIAIERENSLQDFLESGTTMQATVSADLLTTIFTPYSPLHDGAVVIRGDQIIAAGCILPLTQQAIGDKSLGTRHRAALGLSEEADALVIVVSEESSSISLAAGGRIHRAVSPETIEAILAGRQELGTLSPATA